MNDLPLTVSVIALLLAVSVNAHNYMRESQYLKHKYFRKGYRKALEDNKLL